MPTFLDLFQNRPFQAVELTAMVERLEYRPTLLGDFGQRLFPVRPARTRSVAVAKTEGYFQLIPTSPIGAPPVELEKRPADMRSYLTRRLAKGSTLYADSLTGLLLMPELTQLAGIQSELATRGSMLRGDLEITMEHMRFGAIMGRVLDADGETVLDDWWVNWGVAQPDWIIFNLNQPVANLRASLRALRRDIMRNSRGGWVQGTELYGLCGDQFFEKLITHPEVERTYLNWMAAAELRDETPDVFRWGGVTFIDYRGTDDEETMHIADDEVHFFPVGGNEVFHQVFAPGEFEPFINQPGRDIYALTIPDRDRGAWVRLEIYNYPLYICTRPEMLRRGKLNS